MNKVAAIAEAERTIQERSLTIEKRWIVCLLQLLEHVAILEAATTEPHREALQEDFKEYSLGVQENLRTICIKIENHDLAASINATNIKLIIEKLIADIMYYLKNSFEADYTEKIIEIWHNDPFWQNGKPSPEELLKNKP